MGLDQLSVLMQVSKHASFTTGELAAKSLEKLAWKGI